MNEPNHEPSAQPVDESQETPTADEVLLAALASDFTARLRCGEHPRRILEIVCLNCTLVDVTLCPIMRKPFDVLAEGLITKDSRGNWHSFEPLLAAYLDSALDSEAEVGAVERLPRLSA